MLTADPKGGRVMFSQFMAWRWPFQRMNPFLMTVQHWNEMMHAIAEFKLETENSSLDRDNLSDMIPWMFPISNLSVYFPSLLNPFEITGYPCNVIGSQWCDLFMNRTIFCSKSIFFSLSANENGTVKQYNRSDFKAFLTNQSHCRKMKDKKAIFGKFGH